MKSIIKKTPGKNQELTTKYFSDLNKKVATISKGKSDVKIDSLKFLAQQAQELRLGYA